MAPVTFDRATKRFGETTAVSELSLQVADGEFMVLVFMWTWNEFLLALVMVSKENLRTAPLGLAFFQGQHTSDLTLLAAGAVIVATPVVIVYVFLQRHFIRGMLTGAVKG